MDSSGPVKSEWRNALRAGAFMVLHTAEALIIIGMIAVGQWWLKQMGDPKLFHWAPVSYILDAMDATVLLLFVTFSVSHAYAAFRGEAHGPEAQNVGSNDDSEG